MTERGMIFAKMDVCFWRDKKFRRAGLEASAYWASALAWLREDETRDGVLPFDQVGAPHGVGDKLGLKLCEKLASPEVGLFAKREHGYELLLYREKGNETKADIEARLAGGKRRTKDWRERQSERASDTGSNGVGDALRDTSPTSHDERHEAVTPSRTRARARSDSDSVSVSSESSGGSGGPLPADSVRPVALDEPMTPGALAAVETVAMTLGWRPADVQAEWVAYVGKVAARRPRSELDGGFQKWLTDAKRYAAKETRADAARGPARGKVIQQGIDPSITEGRDF